MKRRDDEKHEKPEGEHYQDEPELVLEHLQASGL